MHVYSCFMPTVRLALSPGYLWHGGSVCAEPSSCHGDEANCMFRLYVYITLADEYFTPGHTKFGVYLCNYKG